MSLALSIHDLRKTYASGTQALRGADLEVKEGDFFALLGATGAGKTTLIGILTGLVNKTSGTVKVFGRDLDAHGTEIKRDIGMVPQEFNFSIFEKVLDIVVAQAGYFGVSRKKALEEAEKILTELELWGQKDKVSRALSGGMKRRLMIARALIHRPRLLILDEPTAGVDVELRYGMWKTLNRLNAEGTTILMTTHYLEEAEQLCKNLAIIKEGVVVKEGSVKSILKNLDSETWIVDIGDESVEVELSGGESVTHLIERLKHEGKEVTSLRPKGNRLEKLFLSILKK